ncbi:MAG: metalloregulator ArsR/SmtB family transcription factor [Steroidobacteraceae bacterium]
MLKLTIHGGRVDEVAAALKCAAEPTRLRLLALLAHGELTVGEIGRILGQSQPRISRHLKILTETGFLDRFREQQCVYYRVPVSGRSLAWMRRLLEFLDPSEPQLARDRERLASVIQARARAAARNLPAAELQGAGSLPRELGGALVEELGPAAVGELLDVGTGAGDMLQLLGPSAQHAVGVDISTPALRLARTRVHSAGLAHCELQRGDMYALPCEDARFDTVSMDRVLAQSERPVDALREAARALRRPGRLVVVEQYEPLLKSGAPDPLNRLRRWLSEAGFHLERLRPCDPAGAHYIIAVARVAPAAGVV